MTLARQDYLIIGLVSVIPFLGLQQQATTSFSTTETEEDDNDAAIQEKKDRIDDETKEMAESAFLNGTCLKPLDHMKILAHPDTEVAALGIDIPTC